MLDKVCKNQRIQRYTLNIYFVIQFSKDEFKENVCIYFCYNIGEIQITNAFDASLVFLNPTMEEAIDFRQK